MRDFQRGAEVAMQGMCQAFGVQELCTVHVDILWKMILPNKKAHLIHPELLHQGRAGHTVTGWESTWMQRVPYAKSTSKKMPQEEI